MHEALSPADDQELERGHGSGAHAIDDRAPLYLFRVPTLVFAPYEAIATLALELLREPSRVERIRYVVDAPVARRRDDIVRAALSRDRAACELFATATAFVPVVLRASVHHASEELRRGALVAPLFVAVVRAFEWAGLVPTAAPAELAMVRITAMTDDEERSLRGELSVLAVRTRLASHVVFFDDGARELLLVTIPHMDGMTGEPIEKALLDRVDAVLSRRRG